VMPCNGMDAAMGSLKASTFTDIWNSEEARSVRDRVCACTAGCWMIGSVAPAMRKHIRVPASWVLKAKLSGTLPPLRSLDARTGRK